MKSWFGLYAVVAGLALAGVAPAQTTTLTVNGATAADNSATVDVPAGTVMSVTIANATLAGRPYGLFGATANNGAPSGWFLDTNGGTLKQPFPMVTGIATSVVEANYPPLDLLPDRASNPRIRLGLTGTVTLNFKVPSAFSGTIYLQAAGLESDGTTTDHSNAVEVNFTAPGASARAIVSQSATSVNAVQFGALEFTGGDPTSASFTQFAEFANVLPDAISMSDINEWGTHQGGAATDRARSIDWVDATFGPSQDVDNHEYARLTLPAAAGGIPRRSLLRCYDNVTQEGFFAVINLGENPNTPGVEMFSIPGTRFRDAAAPTVNQWKGSILVSPDGTRAAAIYDDTATDPKIFLFATDGSAPWLDLSSSPVATVNVTPAGTKNFSQANTMRAGIFSTNFLWFTIDLGSTADADGRNDQMVFGVDMRATQPVPVQVSLPVNTSYPAPNVVDVVADRSFIRPAVNPTRIAFIAGDTFNNASGTTPENVTKGDWYVVDESAPANAINVTKFDDYSTSVLPRFPTAGEAYNGAQGQAALSPDGSVLAFVSIHSEENGSAAGEDDEVYVCSTLDSDGDGFADDSGLTLFDGGQVTTQARMVSTSVGNTLDDAVDLFLLDNDNLYFFYGIDTSATAKSMDLFHFRRSTGVLANLTRPAVTAPFTTAGTVLPEGYFPSPNGRYLYFARATDSVATSRTNLVGIDTTTNVAFNVTGGEFAGATTTSTVNPSSVGDNFSWHLSFAGGLYPSLCVFTAALLNVNPASQHIWLFDANYPTAAIQITAENPGVAQNVEALSASPHHLGIAWAWTRPTSNLANFQYQDLLFFFRDSLSQPGATSTFTDTVTLGAMDWVRAATSGDANGAAPPGLIVAIGDTGTDNASDAELYYFSLDGTTDQDFDDGTHQMGTTALSGLPFTGFVQIWYVDVP